ncbi:MAG: hypothetical protein ACLQU3_08795 [Limisphaerales bacterium]
MPLWFARFRAKRKRSPAVERSIHRVQTTDEAGRCCRMNLVGGGLVDYTRHGTKANSPVDDPCGKGD